MECRWSPPEREHFQKSFHMGTAPIWWILNLLNRSPIGWLCYQTFRRRDLRRAGKPRRRKRSLPSALKGWLTKWKCFLIDWLLGKRTRQGNELMPALNAIRTNRAELLNFGIYALPPFLVSLFFYLLSPNDILWVQFTLAVLLLQIPWTTYLKWKKRAGEKLPVFALISLMYWVYYAVALFWGARTPSGFDTPFELILAQESITWSLVLAVIGVSAIWLGMKIGVAKRFVPNRLPELKPGLGSIHYLRLLLVVGTLLSSYE